MIDAGEAGNARDADEIIPPVGAPPGFAELNPKQKRYVVARTEKLMSRGDAAEAAGYSVYGPQRSQCGNQVEKSSVVREVMLKILEHKGLTKDKLGDELAWGLEKSKTEGKVITDFKTGEIIARLPDFKGHAAYLSMLKSLHNLNDKQAGLNVAIQNNVSQASGDLKGVTPGEAAELAELIREEIRQRTADAVQSGDPEVKDPDAYPEVGHLGGEVQEPPGGGES